jgi:hypothetical protein
VVLQCRVQARRCGVRVQGRDTRPTFFARHVFFLLLKPVGYTFSSCSSNQSVARAGRRAREKGPCGHLSVVLDARVGEVKEEGEGKLWRGHAGKLHGHLLWQAEAEDAVDALEIRRIARRDAAKLGEGVKVAKLHNICRLVALEVRVVRVLVHNRGRQRMHAGGGGGQREQGGGEVSSEPAGRTGRA